MKKPSGQTSQILFHFSNMSEILKYNPEAKAVSCSPEAVTDAVATLKPTADEAKNALANCNKNIQEENGKKGITAPAYRDILNQGFANDRAKLAKLLGLGSVTAQIDAQEGKIAVEKFTQHTAAVTAAKEKTTTQGLQEQRDALKAVSVEGEKKTATNSYSGLEGLGKKLQGVFGNKKAQ